MLLKFRFYWCISRDGSPISSNIDIDNAIVLDPSFRSSFLNQSIELRLVGHRSQNFKLPIPSTDLSWHTFISSFNCWPFNLLYWSRRLLLVHFLKICSLIISIWSFLILFDQGTWPLIVVIWFVSLAHFHLSIHIVIQVLFRLLL